jgi:hypothetical protein
LRNFSSSIILAQVGIVRQERSEVQKSKEAWDRGGEEPKHRSKGAEICRQCDEASRRRPVCWSSAGIAG